MKKILSFWILSVIFLTNFSLAQDLSAKVVVSDWQELKLKVPQTYSPQVSYTCYLNKYTNYQFSFNDNAKSEELNIYLIDSKGNVLFDLSSAKNCDKNFSYECLKTDVYKVVVSKATH